MAWSRPAVRRAVAQKFRPASRWPSARGAASGAARAARPVQRYALTMAEPIRRPPVPMRTTRIPQALRPAPQRPRPRRPRPRIQTGGGNFGAPQRINPAAMRAGGGDFESWLSEIARVRKLSPSQIEALRTIAQYESGFRNIGQGIQDINTVRGTPAFGPWQVIEPTFNAYADPGYQDWRNPVHSGIAAINYATKKYGSLERVAERFRRTGRGGY